MQIPVLPMVSSEGRVSYGRLGFSGLSPEITETLSGTLSIPAKGEKTTVLVMDVGVLRRRGMDVSVLKRLRIKGARTWFLTHISDADDVFDAFNTDAEMLLFPVHSVRSEDDLRDIYDVSDSVIPAVFVREHRAHCIGSVSGAEDAVLRIQRMGFGRTAVFDLDGSLSEEEWSAVGGYGGVIPCSVTGSVSPEWFSGSGFEDLLRVPE